MKKSDYIPKNEALTMLGTTTPTFNRYALIFNLNGEKHGRTILYKREDVQRVKEMLDSSVQAAIALIQKKAGKRIKEIVFEKD